MEQNRGPLECLRDGAHSYSGRRHLIYFRRLRSAWGFSFDLPVVIWAFPSSSLYYHTPCKPLLTSGPRAGSNLVPCNCEAAIRTTQPRTRTLGLVYNCAHYDPSDNTPRSPPKRYGEKVGLRNHPRGPFIGELPISGPAVMYLEK